jgi:hypothetical protein
MRPRVIMVLAVAAIVLGGIILVPAASARITGGDAFDLSSIVPQVKVTPAPPAAPAAPKPPTLAAAPVSVSVGPGNYFSWALLDRETGAITGSANSDSATNSTESMIKVWIVSDYLRRSAERGEQPSKKRLAQASAAIRDSDNLAAESLYRAGGRTAVTKRMISMCGLTDTRIGTRPGYVGWWSFTEMSAQDAVRLGECVKNGTAAGPEWTKWVLTEMTKVHGTTAGKDQHLETGGGRWGIIDGLPLAIRRQSPVSIKNGWTLLNYDGKWHVNCLAVTDAWVLAVQTRYPGSRGLDYGANVCRSVTAQLVTPQPGAALKVPTPVAKS